MKAVIQTLLCIGLSFHLAAQSDRDSIIAILPHLKADTVRVNVLCDLGFSYWSTNPEAGKKYASEALQLSIRLHDQKGEAAAHNTLGVLHWALGNFSEAINSYKSSLAIAERIGDERTAAKVYNNMAMIYSRMGNYDDALTFYNKTLESDRKNNKKVGMALSYNNIGLTYMEKKDFDASLVAFERALKIYRELGNEINTAQTLSNVGLSYYHQKRYEEALLYYKEAESIYVKSGNKRGLSILFTNIGNAYLFMNSYPEAKSYFNHALLLGQETGIKELVSDSYLGLSKLDSIRGNYQGAYVNFQKHINIKTEIFRQEHARELNDFRVRYETNEKARENELLRKEAALQQANIRQQNYVLAGVLILLLFVTIVAFQSHANFVGKKKANEELRELNTQILVQQDQLKRANEEIRSINDNLENLVRERTLHINLQNRQLRDYAFFNAHRVRGPLARILGLVHLIKLSPADALDTNYVAMLDEASKELDATIREINQVLEQQASAPAQGGLTN